MKFGLMVKVNLLFVCKLNQEIYNCTHDLI